MLKIVAFRIFRGFCMNFEKIVISLLPIVGLFLSFFYKYKANGNISKYSGFRTALSMKSKENFFKDT